MLKFIKDCIRECKLGWKYKPNKMIDELIHQEQHRKEELSEKKVDKMVKESFPASDPPPNH